MVSHHGPRVFRLHQVTLATILLCFALRLTSGFFLSENSEPLRDTDKRDVPSGKQLRQYSSQCDVNEKNCKEKLQTKRVDENVFWNLLLQNSPPGGADSGSISSHGGVPLSAELRDRLLEKLRAKLASVQLQRLQQAQDAAPSEYWADVINQGKLEQAW